MFLANCAMFVLGISGARLFAGLISLSKATLLPTVVVLAAGGPTRSETIPLMWE